MIMENENKGFKIGEEVKILTAGPVFKIMKFEGDDAFLLEHRFGEFVIHQFNINLLQKLK